MSLCFSSKKYTCALRKIQQHFFSYSNTQIQIEISFYVLICTWSRSVLENVCIFGDFFSFTYTLRIKYTHTLLRTWYETADLVHCSLFILHGWYTYMRDKVVYIHKLNAYTSIHKLSNASKCQTDKRARRNIRFIWKCSQFQHKKAWISHEVHLFWIGFSFIEFILKIENCCEINIHWVICVGSCIRLVPVML